MGNYNSTNVANRAICHLDHAKRLLLNPGKCRAIFLFSFTQDHFTKLAASSHSQIIDQWYYRGVSAEIRPCLPSPWYTWWLHQFLDLCSKQHTIFAHLMLKRIAAMTVSIQYSRNQRNTQHPDQATKLDKWLLTTAREAIGSSVTRFALTPNRLGAKQLITSAN